jgi:hypothetical protein
VVYVAHVLMHHAACLNQTAEQHVAVVNADVVQLVLDLGGCQASAEGQEHRAAAFTPAQ